MKRKTIAFIGETSFDKYQGQMLAGAIKAAREIDVNLIRFTLESVINESRIRNQVEIFIDMAMKFRPDGLMFLGWSGDIAQNEQQFIDLLQKKIPIPLLSIGRKIGNIPSVFMDGGHNIREVVEHLIDVHHYKNIAFIQPYTPDERYSAYKEIMEERRLFRPELVVTDVDLKDSVDWLFRRRVKNIADILLDQRNIKIDAIISLYTYETVYLHEELASRGIRVPEDIALTSWEDGDRGRYAYPALSSVYYPFFEQAYEGCKILHRLISGETIPQDTLVPGRLVVRRSCGCLSQKIEDVTVDLDTIRAENDHSNQKITESAHKIASQLKVLKIENLLPHYFKHMENPEENDFLLYIEQTILAQNESCDHLYAIQQDLLLFRSVITPYIANDVHQLMSAENLWLKCQIIIEENIEVVIGFNEILNRGKGHMMQEIGQDIMTTLDLTKLLDIIETSITKIDVPNCLLALYPEGSGKHDHGKIVYFYRDRKRVPLTELARISGGEAIFNEFMQSDKAHVFSIHLLHINKELIGYMMFEPGPEDERIYTTLSVQTGSSIHAAQTLNNLKETNIHLQSAQDEIIRSMEIIKEKTSELEESNTKLSQLDKLKNDFIANITHDFRSPLMVILNTTDLGLMYDTAADIETVQRRYSTILTASLKLKDTIDRLLELAKMDAQGVKINLKKVHLREYMTNIVDFYKSAAASSSITVNSILPEHEIENFYTDIDKLEEILHNLISNAFKFVDPSRGKITLSLIDRDDSIVIMIMDNGIGIPHDKLDAIFGRFEQIENTASGKHKGTGIGLAFAKQLVGFLNGSIWAESDGSGKGARFFVELKKGMKESGPGGTLPGDFAAPNEKRKNLEKIIKDQISENSQSDEPTIFITTLNTDEEYNPFHALIVIVDDNPYIREIVKEYLSKRGYVNFILANNGKTGIEMIYQYRPDLIICDYNMPKLRGDELHDMLHNNPDFRHIPIIFLTAMVNRELMLDRKQKGAIAYLGKPIDENEFMITVDLGIHKHMEHKQLIHQASIDGLTGLANKQTILKFLKDRLMLRAYHPISVIFFDFDNFKAFNDTYGHQAGDAALAEIGKIIRECVRGYDKAGRYGGEEFFVILPETSINKANIVAEKLRSQIDMHAIRYDGKELKITASFGVASLIDNEDSICDTLSIPSLKDIYEVRDLASANWAEIDRIKGEIGTVLLRMADKALYEAKYTICTKCHYKSEKVDNFKQGTCPVCHGTNLVLGRNKVVLFDGK
ncbi:MAG TPA: diguanylate cyclase [Spirochaetota bacterium]